MPILKIDGDAKKAIKAHADLKKAIKDVGNEAGITEKKLNKQDRAARRIQEAVDPQKRYNRQLQETARLTNRGNLSMREAQLRASQLRGRLDGVGKAGHNAFAHIVGGIKAAATGMLTIGLPIAAISKELQKIAEFSEKRTQANLTVAQAEQNLRQNIFTFTPAQRDAMLSGARSIAKSGNQQLAPIMDALRANISGTGDPELTLGLVDIATKFTRDPAAIKDIAGGLGDVAITSGIRDPKEALGFLTIAQAGARIEETAQVGKQIGKVLASYTSGIAGSDAATGGAMLAALSKGIADKSGELSRTASVNLIDRTRKFFNKTGRFPESETDTFNERLALLFGDKELGTEFVKSPEFGFRASSRGGVAKLILGDPAIRGTFTEYREKLSTSEGRIALAEEALQFVNAGDLQKISRIEGAVASRSEQFRLRPGANLSAERQDEILELIATLRNQSYLRTSIDTFLTSGLEVSPEEAIKNIDSAIGSMGLYRMTGVKRSRESNLTEELLSEIRDVLSDNLQGRATEGRQE